MDGDPGGILIFLLLLLIDVCVYGFGAALHASKGAENPAEDDETQKDEGAVRRKNYIKAILEDQSDYVDSVQTVTAGVNLLLGVLFLRPWIQRAAAAIREGLGGVIPAAAQNALIILSAVLLFLVLLVLLETFGVQIPKRLAAGNPKKWIERTGRIFRAMLVVSLPVIRITGLLSKGILYVFGVRGTPLQGAVTEEEIRSIVDEGSEQGVIQNTEAEMITNIFEFSEKEAADVMTHRNDLVCIDDEMTVNEAITFGLKARNSRFPVYHDNIDTITGIAHFRDLVQYRQDHPTGGDVEIRNTHLVLREAIFVPETKNIDELFRQMQAKKAQMVIVIDEYGQTSGIVAMEDILEEIVGNIMDEYDVDENHITPTGNKNEYIIDGRTPLDELGKRFGITFDDDRFETLNGFMMSCMDRVPEPDDHFSCEYKGYRFRILSVENRQVQRVLMTRL